MDKVNELVVEFELKEYLRYLYYDIFTNKFSWYGKTYAGFPALPIVTNEGLMFIRL